MFSIENLVQARIHSGSSLLSLTGGGGSGKQTTECCNCKGPLKFQLACGFRKKVAQYACSNKCRNEFFEKAKTEEDDIDDEPPVAKPNAWYEKIASRFERTVEALGYDENDLPKGIKITNNYKDHLKQIKWKEEEEENSFEIKKEEVEEQLD